MTTSMETKEKSSLSKRRVQPPLSSRTLYHPSFTSLYTDPGVRQCCGNNRIDFPIIPQEFFYTDPTMMCGTRIPNHVQELKDFDCFQLNTPPPIMSACLAPTNRPDPFRTGLHLTRNLGSSSWEMGTQLLPINRRCAVIQLTQEEDEAITNLLKLHHGDEMSPMQQLNAKELLVSNKDGPSLHFSDQTHQLLSHGVHTRQAEMGELRNQWSDAELEVANTLLTLQQVNTIM